MKTIKSLAILFFIFTITSCEFKIESSVNSKKNKISKNFKLSKEELVGKWIQTSIGENKKSSNAQYVIDINFKEDFTADIKLSDSTGTKTVIGSWSNKETERSKKIASKIGLNLTFDVFIEYFRNDNGLVILTLSEELNNHKTLLKSGDVIFEKE